MPKRKAETYNRARLEIMSTILPSGLCKNYGNSVYAKPFDDKYAVISPQKYPPIGSLVVLFCAPASKWYMSWMMGIEEGDWPKFLLKSIEDGELCRWENVSFFHFPIELTDINDHWKWSDRKYEFKDRWFRACGRLNDYINVPCYPEFSCENNSVILRTRKRFGIGDGAEPKTFPDWRKVKSSEMEEYYKSLKP